MKKPVFLFFSDLASARTDLVSDLCEAVSDSLILSVFVRTEATLTGETAFFPDFPLNTITFTLLAVSGTCRYLASPLIEEVCIVFTHLIGWPTIDTNWVRV